jgi:cytochrome bd-type quinol oxidase subunit 1
MPMLAVPFVLLTGVYLFLGAVVVLVMRRQFAAAPRHQTRAAREA